MEEMVVVEDMFILGNKGLWTLFHLKFARHIKAEWWRSGDRSTVLMEMINYRVR
jgi:hypothetical protein